MPKLGLNPHIYLRDDHPENIYRAIDEIALLKFDGIELSGWYGERWLNRPQDLARLLDLHGLQLSTYYYGVPFLDESRTTDDEEGAYRRAHWLAEVGAKDFLIDGGHPTIPRDSHMWDISIGVIADACNRIGELAHRVDVQLAWHNHWGSFFEQEEALHLFFERTNPEWVKFCPDTAQLRLSGMNEVQIIERYKHRISYAHFKDIAPNWTPEVRKHHNLKAASDGGGYNLDSQWRMIELGRGVIDLPACWNILKSVGFNGWIVDDHDFTGYPAMRAAEAIKRYLNEEWGIEGPKGRDETAARMK